MLLFVMLFYSAVFVGNLVTKKGLRPEPVSASDSLKPGDFKQKEDDFKRNIVKQPGLVTALSYLAVIVLAAGLYLDGRLLWLLRKKIPWVPDGLPHEPVAWGVAHVAGAVVLMFFAEAVLLILETAFFFFSGSKSVPRDFLLMFNSLFRDTVVAGTIIYVVTRKLGHRLPALGLTLKDFSKNVLRGLAGYAAILPLLLVLLVVMGMVVNFFSYEPPPQKVIQIYLKKSSDPYLIFFTLFVAGIGPVIEEIFFRGYAYKAFRQKYGVMVAMVITSLIFSAFHLNLAAFVPIFLLGMFLCYLYEATGSLVPSMTAHMLHNLLMVSFTLGFKSIAG